MNVLKKTRLWIILTTIFAILFAIFLVGYFVLLNFSAAVNMFFNTKEYKTVKGNSGEKPIYYDSDYEFMSSDPNFEASDEAGKDLFNEDARIIEQIEAEGAVLLWNDDALPLDKSKTISLLGRGSQSLVETGSGSGWIPSSEYSATLKSAFEDIDVEINQTLWNFYNGKPLRTEKNSACTEGSGGNLSVNELPWSQYTTAVKNSFANTTAVVVLSRTGGEYRDLFDNGLDSVDGSGNYLALTKAEIDLLDNVRNYKNDGTFDKVVLLINSGNPLQLDKIAEYKNDGTIDAAMYIGEVGTTGANAVAKLLVAEDGLAPSGHLTDTWTYNHNSAPATANDGDYDYAKYATFKDENAHTLVERQGEYMVYQEGIYVGYRYFETRYEDCVLGNGGADSAVGSTNGGAWGYSNEVAFPFGHGESYTTFSYSDFKVDYNSKKGEYEISVKVKNEGEMAAKDVVEIYLQKPYTQFDIDNGLEQASVQLVGFAKTGEINKGKTTTVTVTVDEKYLTTYDDEVNQKYIVEGGDYYFAIGQNAHDALNNILAAKGKTVADGMTANGNANLANKTTISENLNKYTYSIYNNEVVVTNQLDTGDLDAYSGVADENFAYLSRNAWSETYPTTHVKLTMTQQLANALTWDKAFEEDPEAQMPTYGAENGLTIAMVMNEPYDSQAWEDLLDQMTWEEQALMCSNAYHRIEGAVSISLDQCMTENGPVGITKRSDFPKAKGEDYIHVSYPCGPIMGGTWNVELVEEMGKHMSEDMLYTGYQGIYGPGLNLHRTSFGGRNWEYPSEDAFLSGTIGAAECRGIENKGCTAYVKHYALNDTETNRRHVGIWSNEQATRELYLLPFEMVFAAEDSDEAAASACMNSFTRIGATWCGASSELLINILREEWNWTGIMISDWDTKDTMSKIDGILNGTDSFDGNNNASVYSEWKDSPTVAQALRTATKHIIYTTAHTNIMNGISSDDRVVPALPWWKSAIIAVFSAFGVLAAASSTCLTLSIIKNKKESI